MPAPIVVKPDLPAATSSASSVPPSVAADDPGESSRYQLTPDQESRWPVKGPEPLPGALLPDHLIVAFYGNPKSKKMGILGQLPPEEMLPRLEAAATEWAKVERGRKVLPALHAVVTVAQGKPGKGGMYRLQHPDALIEKVLSWAEDRRWIVFLDVQLGGSSVAEELPRLAPYLERPYVHLALDPEYAMQPGGIPGRRVGTLDAAQVNEAVDLLAAIVDQQNIPPKVLVVHRFSQGMLTNYRQIKLDRRVQVVMNMDGFGTPRIKEDAYKFYIALEPVQFTGFKLFYKKDRPMMPPERVLGLTPSERGLATVEEAATLCRTVGRSARAEAPQEIGLLAEVLWNGGQTEPAISLLTECIGLFQKRGEPAFSRPLEIYRTPRRWPQP